MQIVFMGTPDFARRPLEYLHQCKNHDILAVVTGPDKKAGRGQKMIATPVKKMAVKLGIPVLTPERLKNESFREELLKYDADLYVVVAFRILPEKIYTIPPRGSINLHGSLLPKYRGAAPINWALINGEEETGLTTFFLKKKVDTGDMIYQEKIKIDPDDNFDSLYQKMSERAGPAIEKTLDLIERNKVQAVPQENAQATPAPKITPEDALIDWGFPSDNITNFIRGLSSKPGAYSTFRGKKLKLLKAQKADSKPAEKTRPGQVIKDKHRFLVASADGAVELLEVIPEGKARMTGEQFLRGYRPEEKDILGDRPVITNRDTK